MRFDELRIKEIHGVLRYCPNITRWISNNRRDHIVGIHLRGDALHIMDHKSFVISENCVYFLNQKDDYRVELYNATEALSIHFTTYEEIDTDSFCFPVQNGSEIVSLLQKAERYTSDGNELMLRALIYKICGIFESLRIKPYTHRDARILEAKSYIDQHFTKNDCMKNAVRESNLGDRRFRDLFRRMFNMTPNKYLTLKKIEYAQSLISAGGISVAEVSERCGFSDVYYFSKVFKQICDVPPSKWK